MQAFFPSVSRLRHVRRTPCQREAPQSRVALECRLMAHHRPYNRPVSTCTLEKCEPCPRPT
eukprot:2804303-Prymnesium_polylepis.1